MGSSAGTSDVKQLGRARVFAFFWAFVIIAIGNVINEENDIFLHVVDDYTDIILAVIAIAVMLYWWRMNKSPQGLKMVNNVLTILAVGIALATIFAMTQEFCPAGSTTCDPSDFGNEIPTLFFSIFMLINRFV